MSSKNQLEKGTASESELPKRGYKRISQNRSKMIVNNLLGGIAWGMGSIIGAALTLTFVSLLVHFIGGLPFIGGFLANIIKEVKIQLGP